MGHSLLQHNLIFNSPSNLFCLDLKITISVCLTLSEILFVFSHLTRCFKSALTSLFNFNKVTQAYSVTHSIHLQYSSILQTRMDQRKDPMKTNINIFQIQKSILNTVRAQTVDEKKLCH